MCMLRDRREGWRRRSAGDDVGVRRGGGDADVEEGVCERADGVRIGGARGARLAVAAVSEHKEQSARLTASSGAAGPTLACPPACRHPFPSSVLHCPYVCIVHPNRGAAPVSSGVRAGLLFTSLFCLYGTLE